MHLSAFTDITFKFQCIARNGNKKKKTMQIMCDIILILVTTKDEQKKKSESIGKDWKRKKMKFIRFLARI